MAPQALRIDTPQSAHIPVTVSRKRPGFRANGMVRPATPGDNRWISTREVRRCILTLRLAPSSASTSARRSCTSWTSTPLAHLSKKQSYDATQFFAEADPTLVGMEACPGSQWLARKLRELGHDVRIIPAQFVKPYVKSHKNDIIDAEAIAEAATRPTVRFVGIKEAHQVDLQMRHRVRSRLVKGRTNLICQMRSYCLEHGVALRQGARVFKLDIARAIYNLENDLTDRARVVSRELQEDLLRLEERVLSVSAEIKNIADRDETARRLMTIPGVGPLGATAILASIGDPTRFKKARDVAA